MFIPLIRTLDILQVLYIIILQDRYLNRQKDTQLERQKDRIRYKQIIKWTDLQIDRYRWIDRYVVNQMDRLTDRQIQMDRQIYN